MATIIFLMVWVSSTFWMQSTSWELACTFSVFYCKNERSSIILRHFVTISSLICASCVRASKFCLETPTGKHPSSSNKK